MAKKTPKWKLHIPTDDNLFVEYKCGLKAGQRVALKKDLVVRDHLGMPTETIPKGEIWDVLPGMYSDPVLWFRTPNGERHTWDDDAAEVAEWFEICQE